MVKGDYTKLKKTQKDITTSRNTSTFKILTLNIYGLRRKEIELIEEIDKRKIKIIGIADTRFAGRGCNQLHKGYTLIYSGVEVKERAKHGVGFIVHPDTSKKITNIKYH
jgi:exonuclease III